ncbi:MAG: hypothetical protein PHV05_08340, partial [Candidatus Riflebacteria bacterium]|nr:hypothetical protein [Candidatus Riflebacteria bacterium]
TSGSFLTGTSLAQHPQTQMIDTANNKALRICMTSPVIQKIRQYQTNTFWQLIQALGIDYHSDLT